MLRLCSIALVTSANLRKISVGHIMQDLTELRDSDNTTMCLSIGTPENISE